MITTLKAEPAAEAEPADPPLEDVAIEWADNASALASTFAEAIRAAPAAGRSGSPPASTCGLRSGSPNFLQMLEAEGL